MNRYIWVQITMLLIAMPAFAGPINTYTDRSTFSSAVGGPLTIEDFTQFAHYPIRSGVLNASTNEAGITPGTIKSGVTYSTPIGLGNFFNIDAGGGYVGGFLDGFSPSNRKVEVTFDSPTTAFGFDSGGLGSLTIDVVIHFVSGPDQAFTLTYPSSKQFFGFQSASADITGATINNNGGFFGFDFDNFTFESNSGGASAVPEPASMITLAAGALGMLGFRMRKQKADAGSVA